MCWVPPSPLLPSFPPSLPCSSPGQPFSLTHALWLPAGHLELAGWPGFESWPPHLLAGCVWVVNYVTYLSFLICKIQGITVPPPQPSLGD